MANSVLDAGWRRPRLTPSLAEVYRTVPVKPGAWWKKALAFAGPGYLVAVGYMDPATGPPISRAARASATRCSPSFCSPT